MSSIVFTIAIPNFNHGRYLERCLQSAVTQNGEDIEILVADNCSNDDSWSIIRSFTDPRIRSWQHERNIGLYPNWNFLLNQARGKYFKLLQSDDWLEPDFATKLHDRLKDFNNTNVSALLLGYRINDERPKPKYSIANPILPQAPDIPEIFVPGECFGAAYRSLSYSMPTLNLLNTSLARRVGGYLPEDAMRADSIIFSRILAAEPFWSVVAVNAALAVTSIHLANDRWRYARFEAFRDETVFLNEIQSLALSKDERRMLSQKISRAAAQTLLSLPLDLIRRKKVSESVQNGKYLLGWEFARRAFLAAPTEVAKLLFGKVARKS